MPIHCPVTIRRLSAEEFEKIDYRVMGQAYASQNELGRLCDECVYETDLQARLITDGFKSVMTQVPVTVSHRDFLKQYYIDLIVDDALYELKSAFTLNGDDDAQLLNYILLLELGRGKLLNFRTPRVEGKIVASGLTLEERRRIRPLTERWRDLSQQCAFVRETMLELLQDWGSFLDIALYQEALVHFLGGAAKVEQRIGLRRNGLRLGSQRMLLHAPDLAFRFTALTEGQKYLENHQQLLLALTDLKAIQWINLNRTRVEFITIQRL